MATYNRIYRTNKDDTPLPGVQSIGITVQNALGGFTPQTAAKQGDTVRFAVLLYNSFNITNAEVYYADEYDDTINVTITPVSGASNTWDFTMPNAVVYIRVEAESNASRGDIPDEQVDIGTVHLPNYTILDMYKAVLSKSGYSDYDEWTINVNSLLGRDVYTAYPYYISLQYFPGDGASNLRVFPGITPEDGRSLPYAQNSTFVQYSDGYRTTFNSNTKTITVSGLTSSTSVTRSYDVFAGTKVYSIYMEVSNLGYSPASGSISIRYIMSPENSGELVEGQYPTEIEADDSSFTFKWRIKANYELKRITSFAVGSGASETSIPNNYTYDGDTRTYTVTITGIIEGVQGVRVIINTIQTGDPNVAGGTNASNGPIGGNGTFDDTSDDVPLPAIPEGISAADSGFVTLFRPTISQLKSLGNYLWSNLDEFWENLQKIFTNPMDYIIGLNLFPVSPTVGANKNIYIGNWLTNISMPPVNNQYYEFDCGIRTIDEYFGSFLDYGPNTSARIMLPFIGDRDLDINEIMGKTLHLWYRINLLSGECLAALTINNSTYYQWNGNCAIPIPVTGSDWSRLYGGIGRTVGAGVGFALGGLIGMGIGGAMGAMATAGSNVNYVPFTGVDNQTHYQRIGAHTPYDRASQLAPDPIREPPREEFGLSLPAKAALAATTSHIIGNNIMGATPRVAHSGDISGGISIMGNRTPYIVLEYPNVNLPENYKHLYGYPSNQYVTLGNLSGYTECKAVMFESTTATDDEVDLIIRTLKSGVYL